MTRYNPLTVLLFNHTPKPKSRRPHRTDVNRSSRDKHIVIKHKGRLKHYRVNKYGEIFEKK